MFCKTCGKEINDKAVICPNCGCPTANKVQTTYEEDKASGGLIALSILIPIAGIILWPVKHSQTPKAARTYGLCGIISWVVFGILYAIMLGGM
ncbi:MAG: zinc ribbon domain-containing protein [Clostridia bacterium]|nr:zinc ribbon domain-containing protein [Clostridia bacterium]